VSLAPTINYGRSKFLNLPHAAEVIREIVDEDCYRLGMIPDRSTVIDVGAFYGEFGLICHLNKQCKVIAFEPSVDNFQVAKANVALNNIELGSYAYDLNHVAISSTNGKIEFYHRLDHPAGSSSCKMNGLAPVPVVCVTMQYVIQTVLAAFGSENPIVVKLDCEGAEKEIFENDLDWLSHVSILCMEWHNYDGHIYADALRGQGFSVEITGSGIPRPKYDKSMAGGLLFATKQKA